MEECKTTPTLDQAVNLLNTGRPNKWNHLYDRINIKCKFEHIDLPGQDVDFEGYLMYNEKPIFIKLEAKSKFYQDEQFKSPQIQNELFCLNYGRDYDKCSTLLLLLEHGQNEFKLRNDPDFRSRQDNNLVWLIELGDYDIIGAFYNGIYFSQRIKLTTIIDAIKNNNLEVALNV